MAPGVTAAQMGRMLPSDGHKRGKKKREFWPKSAPGRPLFDRPSYFNFVWRAAILPKTNRNLKATSGFLKISPTKPNLP
jgi:hypothetical protein